MAQSTLRSSNSARTAPFLLLALGVLAVSPFALGSFGVEFLMEILIWGLLALSFDFLYGYTGLLSLGHSVFFGVGVYGVTLPILHWQTGLWPAMGIGLLVSAISAVIVGYFSVKIRGHGFIIVTVVFATVMTLIAFALRSVTGGDDGLTFTRPALTLGPLELNLVHQLTRYYFVLFFVALSFFLCRRILRSPLGRVFELIRENETRAGFVGYNADRYKLISFSISGIFAGVSGILYALFLGFASADFFQWTISAEAVVWTLFGGAGTLIGPMLGTGILLYLKELLSSQWAFTYLIFLGAIIIVVVTFAPRGLVGEAREIFARLRERRPKKEGGASTVAKP